MHYNGILVIVGCMYRLLNKALRVNDIHTLFRFQFFISDLYQQLKCIHLEYYDNKIVRVYLATNRELSFIHDGIDVSADNDLVNILLKINIDKHLKSLSKPFADISTESHFHDEQEVLLYIGTIFKIKMIEQQNDNWLIELGVCTDDDYFVNLKTK
ncbi:unnamed protein product [Didymodactylos carnosus]|uniref:Uncharacterized protein n=1 Tax=Didymodactylos carnosus TaxID=1234261 RepID=A0A814UCL5_9BILA|nr:unnamed protein product [Didymodactylos carnosus]CAF3936119.1 unnamed protein product [Didymodactylos carnosus]